MEKEIFYIMVKTGCEEEIARDWNRSFKGGYPGARVIVTEDYEGNNTKNKKGTLNKIRNSSSQVQFDEKLEKGYEENGHSYWWVENKYIKLLKENNDEPENI